MSACPPQELLEQMLAESLPPERHEELERHLLHCDACQEQLGQLTCDQSASRWRKWQAEEAGDTPPLGDPFLRRLAILGAGEIATLVVRPRGAGPTAGRDVYHSLEGDTASGKWPSVLPTVPGYEILAELGRGGMGVVYKARHLQLNRTVALKMILVGRHASTDALAFFQAEARAIARLQHPHIVQIYEIGEHEGLPYLCLEYAGGGSLAECLADVPQPARPAAELIETLARAVHYAHEQGIVHRDLKPANILLASGGRKPPVGIEATGGLRPPLAEEIPKITDFGLAKRLDGDKSLLASGIVAGTPSYMAPEQVDPRSTTGPAADVYALGAILYEVLTGRPPFQGASAYETLLQVAHQEPVPLRQLQPKLPVDLETICLKCLQKDPRKRYSSAGALAADCAAFRKGEPIVARPVGRLERALKWSRRYPALALSLAAVVLVTLTGMALVVWQWRRAEATATAERLAREDAGQKERAEKKARLEVERRSAAILLDQASALCEKGEVAHGLLAFARGLELAVRAQDVDLERVARSNLAWWPERVVRLRAAFHHKSQVVAVAFSPDGNRAFTASKDGLVRRWHTATGGPAGKPLEVGAPVRCLAFSADGTKILTGTDETPDRAAAVQLWNAATGESLHAPLPHPLHVTDVAFSPDGNRFLTVCAAHSPMRPGQCQLWHTATCTPAGPRLHAGSVRCAAFSPDGKTVLTGGADHTARLWETATGAMRGRPLPHFGPLLAVKFAPDGRTMATASQAGLRDRNQKPIGVDWGEVRLWETATGKPGTVLTHHGPVLALAFSKDGKLLASASGVLERRTQPRDFSALWGEARVWDAATGQPRGKPLFHPSAVWSVAFSPDGSQLLTGCEDARARLFGVAAGDLLGTPLPHEGMVGAVAFSPDGRLGLTASAGGDEITGAAARLWELPSGQTPRLLAAYPGGGSTVALSRDGGSVLIGKGRAKNAELWDVAKGRRFGPPLSHDDDVLAVGFSPDESLLATGGRDGKVRLWERATGKLVRTFVHASAVEAVAISPDGQRVLAAEFFRVTLWDARSGVRLAVVDHEKRGALAAGYDGRVAAAAFNAAGEALWIEGSEQAARLWRCAAAGQPERLWQRGGIFSGAFQEGGQMVLVTSANWYPQLCDAQTGRPRGKSLPKQGERIAGLAVSADGRTAATGGWDGTARLWDLAAGKPLGPPLYHRGLVGGLALHREGRLLATGDDDGVKVWRVPAPSAGSPERVRLGVEVLTGLELTAEGTTRELEPEAVRQRRERLAAQSGGSAVP